MDDTARDYRQCIDFTHWLEQINEAERRKRLPVSPEEEERMRGENEAVQRDHNDGEYFR